MVAIILIALVGPIVSQQAPAGWDATYQRALQLILDHKTADAIALLEGVLKSSPGFDPARYELADTQRMLALEALVKGPSQQATSRREFERAAANYRRVAQGTSEYKPLAIGKLLLVYGDDELNQPAELVQVARQYVQISPGSAVGHVTLANALIATGQEAPATVALLAARTAVRTDDRPLLATMIVDYVLKAKTSSIADLKALLDWADGILDGQLRQAPTDRQLLLTRAASASLRADRLEADPAKQRALKAEADRAFSRFEDANPNRGSVPTAPSAAEFAAVPPPPPPPPPMPPDFQKTMAEASNMVDRKQYVAAAAVWEKLIKSNPEFPPSHYMRANALLLAGQHPAFVAALKTARTSIGAGAESRHMAATYLFDMVSSNKTIAAADAKVLLSEALVMVDDALKKNPKYWEAAVYKSLIVRTQAKYETDPAAAKKLIAEADRLRALAETLRPRLSSAADPVSRAETRWRPRGVLR